MEAEERGQGEAIARNLYEMSALKVPVLCIMIGEGGSGGALALAVGNEVWMIGKATIVCFRRKDLHPFCGKTENVQKRQVRL